MKISIFEMHYLLKISILLTYMLHQLLALQGDNVGCFEFNTSGVDVSNGFTHLINFASAAESPNKCIIQCRQLQYKYAFIYNSKQCYCASMLVGVQGINITCPLPCISESNLFCGGPQSASAYETGIILSGPPSSLIIQNRTENSLRIKWEHPQITNGPILEYFATATPVSSYSLSNFLLPLEWHFPNSTTATELLGLQPGTKYNVSLKAKTVDGYGTPITQLFTTEIGEPNKPERPVVLKSANNTATIQLKPVLSSYGPVSAYRIIAVNEEAAALVVHKDTVLKSYAEASAEKLPHYITAELKPEEFKQEFVVGDGKIYGRYINPPLPDDREVLFILGVVSTYEGVSKYSFSEPSMGVEVAQEEKNLELATIQTPISNQLPPVIVEEDSVANGNSIIKLFEETDLIDRLPSRKTKPITRGRTTTRRQRIPYGRDPPALVVGLSAAIGVLGFLLILSIFVYFYLRHRVHKNDRLRRARSRKNSDKQGLTWHGGSTSTIELDSGYVHSSFVMGVEETPIDHYDSLMKRLWSIPQESVLRGTEILGTGQYGKVKKGFVLRGDSKIEAALHLVEDKSMTSGEKNAMLKDLGVLVKVGQHANVAGLIGVCDEAEQMVLAIEHYGINLKEFLLNSRALNNYPSYANKEQRFSTLHEAQAIDIALGIARGMAYLQSLSVPHKRLISRTVLISNSDGTVPKISGFGMDFYQPCGQVHDTKRWTAPEALTSHQHAPKCEVWSFAVILWEIVTLGATPYADVRATKELIQRVQRGLRLKQPTNIGLALYQIMISCWQIDLDERPSFQELVEVLQQAFNNAVDYLTFNLTPDFVYEKYDPNLESSR